MARIERGQTTPTTATLERLLAAAGFDLECALLPTPIGGTHVLEDVERILCVTPEERPSRFAT